jgi:hypothetical protein
MSKLMPEVSRISEGGVSAFAAFEPLARPSIFKRPPCRF